MRLYFQTDPLDIYAAVGYSFVVSAFFLAIGAGSVLGIVLVVFVPGYLLTAALLPGKGSADALLRAGLSLGLSLALGAFAGVVLVFTPWGVTFTSVTVALLVLSIALGVLAYRRRMRLPPEERLEVNVNLQAARWSEYSLVEKLLAVVVVVILAVAAPLTATALLQPRPTQPFTELYLLSAAGNLTGYPSRLNISEPGTVDVVVANHEAATMNYTLRVDLVGVRIFFNVSSRANESIELNRTTWTTSVLSVPDGANWTEPYTFTIRDPGTWEVNFLLFRTPDLSTIYRSVYLLVVVT